MFRLPPSRVRLSSADIDPANFSNRVDLSAPIAASQALNVALQSPRLAYQAPAVESASSSSTPSAITLLPSADLLSTSTNNNMDTDSAVESLSPSAQSPYADLPYGPEREAVLTQSLCNVHVDLHKSMKEQLAAQSADFKLTIDRLRTRHESTLAEALRNLHFTYHQHMTAQLASQSADSAFTIAQIRDIHATNVAQLRASHQQTVDLLTAELYTHRLQTQIYNWRDGDPSTTTTTTINEPNQATDLQLAKFADLRSGPISALAGVRTAESASDPGLGDQEIEDENCGAGMAAARTSPGRLYGTEEDVRAFLGAVGGDGGAAAARSRTDDASCAEEDLRGEDGAARAGLSMRRAAAVSVMMAVEGEEHGEGEGADAGPAGRPRRRGLLRKMKKIFRV